MSLDRVDVYNSFARKLSSLRNVLLITVKTGL